MIETNPVHSASHMEHVNALSEPVHHSFGWYADAQQHVLEQERKARGAGHQHTEQYVATNAEDRKSVV